MLNTRLQRLQRAASACPSVAAPERVSKDQMARKGKAQLEAFLKADKDSDEIGAMVLAFSAKSKITGRGVPRPDFDCVQYKEFRTRNNFANHGTHFEWMEESEYYIWHDNRKGEEKRKAAGLNWESWLRNPKIMKTARRVRPRGRGARNPDPLPSVRLQRHGPRVEARLHRGGARQGQAEGARQRL